MSTGIARAAHDKRARQAASAIIGAVIATMRGQGMTWRAINAELPARALAEVPETWVELRGTLAGNKRLGLQRCIGMYRRYMEAQAANAVESAESQRTLINARLDEQYELLATTQAARDGDPKTIDAMRKIEADRATLYGLREKQAGGELAAALSELARAAQPRRLGNVGAVVVDVQGESSKAPRGVEGGTPSST